MDDVIVQAGLLWLMRVVAYCVFGAGGHCCADFGVEDVVGIQGYQVVVFIMVVLGLRLGHFRLLLAVSVFASGLSL